MKHSGDAYETSSIDLFEFDERIIGTPTLEQALAVDSSPSYNGSARVWKAVDDAPKGNSNFYPNT